MDIKGNCAMTKDDAAATVTGLAEVVLNVRDIRI